MSDRMVRVIIAAVLFAGGNAYGGVRSRSGDFLDYVGDAACVLAITMLLIEYVNSWGERWKSTRNARGFPVLPAEQVPDQITIADVQKINNIR